MSRWRIWISQSISDCSGSWSLSINIGSDTRQKYLNLQVDNSHKQNFNGGCWPRELCRVTADVFLTLIIKREIMAVFAYVPIVSFICYLLLYLCSTLGRIPVARHALLFWGQWNWELSTRPQWRLRLGWCRSTGTGMCQSWNANSSGCRDNW